MPDFESIIKFLVLAAGGTGIFLGAGFGLKALFRKPPADELLHERLADAERRLTELEERAEFAERVISEVRERSELPPGH